MGDIENFNEQIDDLRDQVHDLEYDLRASEKEIQRLEAEIQGMLDDQEHEEGAHKKEVDALAYDLETARLARQRLDTERAQILEMDKLKYDNYIRALSIAETLHAGNLDYFKTTTGRNLLNWAVEELKREVPNITKG